MYTNIKQKWFIVIYWILITTALITVLFSASFRTDAQAQAVTQTPSDVYVTVTNAEQINVRNGPSTVLYNIIGNMQPGETAKALRCLSGT